MLCRCFALALDATKIPTKKRINNPLIRMATMAGTRMPFMPCLEMPNKATIPKMKPTTMSKSENCTINGAIFLATKCRLNIKSAKIMALTTGQTQPSFAARCENDFVAGGVSASI